MMNVALVDPKQDERFSISAEHRFAMAMQSIRGGISELTALLENPQVRPLFAKEPDIAGGALALSLIASSVNPKGVGV